MDEYSFRWCSLQIDALCNRNIKSEPGLRGALHSLPKTLAESYDFIYEQILALDTYSKSLAKQAIISLLYARRQLYIHEFVPAVFASVKTTAYSDDGLPDITHLLGICCNVVVTKGRPASAVVDLAHLSVREYFEAKEDYRSKFGHIAILNSSFATLSRGHQELDRPFRSYAKSF